MLRLTAPISLLFVCFIMLSWQSPLCPQDKPRKDKFNPIEGDWTLLISEGGMGGLSCRLPDRRPNRMPGTLGVEHPIRWKITKETIEEGMEVEGRFPYKRYTYKLNPGNQANAIDVSLDEIDLDFAKKADRRKLDAKDKTAAQGIYFVSGDYLMICRGGKSRPKSFTTNDKDNPTTIEILHRGRLYKKDDKSSSNPKPKDSSKSKGKGK